MSSAADRNQQRLEQLHARLAAEVEALCSGEEWVAWLRAAARFHRYSFNNVALIRAQRPDATQVAGYRTWQGLGRQVNRGEPGIAILAPVHRRVPAPADESAGSARTAGFDDPVTNAGEDDRAESARRLVGWRVSHVWDVGQTSGQDLPAQPEPVLLAGQGPAGLWDAVAAQITGHGFSIVRGDCGPANGVTDFAARVVRIRPDLDQAQAVKTLAHDLLTAPT